MMAVLLTVAIGFLLLLIRERQWRKRAAEISAIAARCMVREERAGEARNAALRERDHLPFQLMEKLNAARAQLSDAEARCKRLEEGCTAASDRATERGEKLRQSEKATQAAEAECERLRAEYLKRCEENETTRNTLGDIQLKNEALRKERNTIVAAFEKERGDLQAYIRRLQDQFSEMVPGFRFYPQDGVRLTERPPKGGMYDPLTKEWVMSPEEIEKLQGEAQAMLKRLESLSEQERQIEVRRMFGGTNLNATIRPATAQEEERRYLATALSVGLITPEQYNNAIESIKLREGKKRIEELADKTKADIAKRTREIFEAGYIPPLAIKPSAFNPRISSVLRTINLDPGRPLPTEPEEELKPYWFPKDSAERMQEEFAPQVRFAAGFDQNTLRHEVERLDSEGNYRLKLRARGTEVFVTGEFNLADIYTGHGQMEEHQSKKRIVGGLCRELRLQLSRTGEGGEPRVVRPS